MQMSDGRAIFVYFLLPDVRTEEPFTPAQQQKVLGAIARCEAYLGRPMVQIHVSVLGHWDMAMASENAPVALNSPCSCPGDIPNCGTCGMRPTS